MPQEKLTATRIIQLLTRYLPLMEELDRSNGYDIFMVQLHGKRPVKLWRVSAPEVLEMLGEPDSTEIVSLIEHDR